MMALPLLRVAVVEPTQNSPHREKVRLRISHSITSTPWRSTTS